MPGISFLLTLFAVSMADALPSDPQILAEAEAAFQAGAERRSTPAEARSYFQIAAEQYEQLRGRGVDGSAINQNLGNAYLLAGDVPRAILAYRRALRFAGSDRHIQVGLAFARAQVAYPAGGSYGRPPVEQRPPWLPRVASVWYMCIGFVTYLFGWFALTCWRAGRPGRWLLGAAVSFSLTLLLVAGLAAEEWRDADLTARPVVVLSDDGVLLRTGNGLSYPPRSETPLNRGVEARLLFIRGDWLQIQLASGEIGWVPREYAMVDELSAD
jgi:tetratricopeptide (TPR) repeat protein